MSTAGERLGGAEQLLPGRRLRTLGVLGAARGWLLAQLSDELGAPLLCVTQDEATADALASDLAFFLTPSGDTPAVLRLPAEETLPWDELAPDAAVVCERLGALARLCRGDPVRAVVASARGLSRRVLPPAVLRARTLRVTRGTEHGRDALARHLTDAGYQNVPLVEDPGTFSLRGDIVDVFAPLAGAPVRVEFFGDTVDALRTFDPATQRTLTAIEAFDVLPAREVFLSPSLRPVSERAVREAAEVLDVPSTRVREVLDQVREGVVAPGLEGLWPGLVPEGLGTVFDAVAAWGKTPLVWLDAPAAVERALEELAADAARSHADAVKRQDVTLPPQRHFLGADEVYAGLAAWPVLEGGGLTLDAPGEAAPVRLAFSDTHGLRQALASHHGEEGALAPLLEHLSALRDEGIAAVVACGSAGQADRLRRLLEERGARTATHAALGSPEALFDSNVLAHLVVGEVSEGFVDRQRRLAVFSDEDIFGARVRRRPRARRADTAAFAAGFSDLKGGDLCVHTDFGVCRYAGLTTMQVGAVASDFLVLEFAGRDKVYLPVSRMRLISRFTGGDPSKVALDRLGGTGWEKRKAFVKEQLLKMAAELLLLYAQRRAHAGFRFSAPDRYFHQFEADFEFDETVDQQKAIDEVLADMQRAVPMDRLVCGDVGYGKTEVAMRAAFKAVLDRKQVAVLVPTTLLAHQHLATFRRRFEGYPVTVEVVSGLQKPQESRDVLRRAAEGRVDVLIGTHKLLGATVDFRDLGLLIIDEEHKFGVKQKEALKRLKATVDSLTLTATPIPRTMNMAMGGLRDLSIIATPPADRRAIRTFVNKFDTQQITEAITRELQRGGQVFFVHNRVASIGSMQKLLKELLPKARVGVAHGQMREGVLERVMLDFTEKRLDVLLCTTIIESGLDISSANTMIVNRADQFGLAQLYQLRGRVGRSKERAFAYLLIPIGRAVSRDAQRRLEVLQAFTELGAGFNIASHDLEIRGAGNLLGKEQSGSIEAVGFDLYTEMLEEAVAEARGDPPPTHVEPDVGVALPAYLPEAFVPDVHQRLVLYKRLSQAEGEAELDDLRAELVDRYGDTPVEVDHLLEVLRLKQRLRALSLRQLDASASRVVVTLGADARIDGAKLLKRVQRSKGRYRLTPDLKLLASVGEKVKGTALLSAAKDVLKDLEACARDED